MKANEAPEKIYVDANERWHRTYTAFSEKAKGNDIEYTRTDAFIEKACEWLRCNNNLHDGEIDDYVNDFRKYMKGEL